MSNHDHHRMPFKIIMDAAIFAVIAYGLIRLVVWLFGKMKDQDPPKQP